MLYRKKRQDVILATTFDELVEHGIASGASVINGMPWAFQYNGRAVTHENDDCYLIPTCDGVTSKMGRGDLLITKPNGEIYVSDADVFTDAHEPLPEADQPSKETPFGFPLPFPLWYCLKASADALPVPGQLVLRKRCRHFLDVDAYGEPIADPIGVTGFGFEAVNEAGEFVRQAILLRHGWPMEKCQAAFDLLTDCFQNPDSRLVVRDTKLVGSELNRAEFPDVTEYEATHNLR
jgi:hypothetical protein